MSTLHNTTTEQIVRTRQGLLRGYLFDDSYVFLGVRYAKAKRFHMPEEPDSWEGVRDAIIYGYASPTPGQGRPQDESLMPLRFWPESEDCQYLNIWSPKLGEDQKKPVMFWIHGGGYAAGSGMEHMYYNGKNLCEQGDVVVVTVNHRLNILGFMDLSPFGEEYAHSGNAGLADLVAALRWVRENIAAFGGDPDNVTLFGQSGGGMKINNLMQTPAADGLYHRAVIQSGILSDLSTKPQGDGRAIVTALMEDLGLTDVHQLETVPYQALSDSYYRVAGAIQRQGLYIGGSPIQDDWFLGDPLRVGFHEYSKTVPTMVGTTLAEFTYTLSDPNKYKKDDAQITEELRGRYGEHTEKIVELYRRAWPGRTIADIPIVDIVCRTSALEYVRAKAAVSSAPVYAFLFSYECPFMGGTPAWHCIEIPFVFRNTRMVPRCNEVGVTDELERNVSDAWVSFARTGDPNHSGLPAWAPCSFDTETTMIFDRTIRAEENFDEEFRSYINANCPQIFPAFDPFNRE